MESNSASTSINSNESAMTLSEELLSLFKEDPFCEEIILKTGTAIFLVHKNVLSARSPVFKRMFMSDMIKKANDCVDKAQLSTTKYGIRIQVLDDLDADTVGKMLSFLYSDTLDNLTYSDTLDNLTYSDTLDNLTDDSAKKLYFAADKYNIVPLKCACSDFLKLHLHPRNCCDVLHLADQHQDKDLKAAVKDYIVTNDDKVLDSQEWKCLEQNHSQLAIEILRAICMKNRKKPEIFPSPPKSALFG